MPGGVLASERFPLPAQGKSSPLATSSTLAFRKNDPSTSAYPGSHRPPLRRVWAVGALLTTMAVAFLLFYCRLRLVTSVDSTLLKRSLASGREGDNQEASKSSDLCGGSGDGLDQDQASSPTDASQTSEVPLEAEGKSPRKRKREPTYEEDHSPRTKLPALLEDEFTVEGTSGTSAPSEPVSSEVVLSSPSPHSESVTKQPLDWYQPFDDIVESSSPSSDFSIEKTDTSSDDDSSGFLESLLDFYIQQALEGEEAFQLDPQLFSLEPILPRSPQPGTSQDLEGDEETKQEGDSSQAARKGLDQEQASSSTDALRLPEARLEAESKSPRKRKRKPTSEEDHSPHPKVPALPEDELAVEGTSGTSAPSEPVSSEVVLSSSSPHSESVTKQPFEWYQELDDLVKGSQPKSDFSIEKTDTSSDDDSSGFLESLLDFYIQQGLEGEEALKLDPQLFALDSTLPPSPQPGTSQDLEGDEEIARRRDWKTASLCADSSASPAPSTPSTSTQAYGFSAGAAEPLQHPQYMEMTQDLALMTSEDTQSTSDDALSLLGNADVDLYAESALDAAPLLEAWLFDAFSKLERPPGPSSQVSRSEDEDGAVEASGAQTSIKVPSAPSLQSLSVGDDALSSGSAAPAATPAESEGKATCSLQQ
ncbi:hypothetical protein ACSSS7_005794 [Eimeria intestinalis]